MKQKLSTKLEFEFNSGDLEVPSLDFLMDDPKEKKKAEIKIYKKTKNGSRQKSSSELF